LLTAEGLAEFRRRFVPKNYEQHPRLSRRFIDRTNQVTSDVLITGFFPGSGNSRVHFLPFTDTGSSLLSGPRASVVV
jgi:hypothetical protein